MRVGIYTFGIDSVELPSYGTEMASCFDLSYQNPELLPITAYDVNGKKTILVNFTEGKFDLRPGERALVRTSMIFDLPQHHDMRVHPRSGLSIKNGITLVNCEGVIDEDYTGEILIPVINLSQVTFVFEPGMRIAQAEILRKIPVVTDPPWANVYRQRAQFFRLDSAPEPKGDRSGGFGSTGTKL